MTDEQIKKDDEKEPAPAEALAETPAENKEAAPEAIEQALEEAKAAKAVEAIELPKIKAGMLVRVHHKIKEMSAKGEEKERIQIFEGLVIGAHGAGNKKTFTVRKVASGVGVEKIFPVSAPAVAKVEVVKQYRMRRAQPTYLRKGYKKKLKEVAMK